MWIFDRPNIKRLQAKRNVHKLIEALGHKDYNIRNRAVEALKRLRSSEAVEPLLKILRDPDSEVSSLDVMAVLGEIKDVRAVEAILTYTDTVGSHNYLRSGLESVDKIDPGNKRMLEFCARYLDHDDSHGEKEVISFVAGLLKKYDWEPDTLEQKLAISLYTEKLDIDKCLQAGEVGAHRLRSELKSIQFDYWYMEIKQPRKVWSFMEMAEALAKLGDPTGVQALVQLLSFDFKEMDPEKVRISAANKLGKLCDKSAVRGLLKLATDCFFLEDELEERLSSVSNQHRVVARAFTNKIRERQAKVRIAAINALKELGDKEAIEPLKRMYYNFHGASQWKPIADAARQAIDDLEKRLY